MVRISLPSVCISADTVCAGADMTHIRPGKPCINSDTWRTGTDMRHIRPIFHDFHDVGRARPPGAPNVVNSTMPYEYGAPGGRALPTHP